MVATAVISFVAMMVWGGFFVTGNTDAIRLIAPLLGIMTGFLIAIITASSDPKHLLPGSWRIANAHRHEVERALSRYQCLFFIYLAAIAAAFTTVLVGALGMPTLSHWAERCTLSLVATALVLTFGLPSVITRLRKNLLKQGVDDRRLSDRASSSLLPRDGPDTE